MTETASPVAVALARHVLNTLPMREAERVAQGALRRIQRRHVRLFDALAELDLYRVHFHPTDIKHAFAVQFGGNKAASLHIIQGGEAEPDASVKGRFHVLMAMLDGRMDGDMLFFRRDIVMTGNTEAIVALRNTMDREKIDWLDDVVTLAGPLAPVVRLAGRLTERAGRGARAHVMEWLRPESDSHEQSERMSRQVESLRTELDGLKKQLAKAEAHRRIVKGEAA